jgi:hypothetical protein
MGSIFLLVSTLFAAVVPGTTARASAAVSPAGPPSTSQRWAALQSTLSGIKGQWTNQDYTGAVSDIMPQTALLGNGDVGVTSGGSTGVKTFYVSKGDFWDGNPTPEPAALGGVTLQSSIPAPGSNLALGAIATASSTDGSFLPANAVNGEWTAGYQGWVSDIGTTQWIALDLGSVQSIGRFIIKNDNAARPGNAANNTSGFQVQTSTDGVNWTTVDTISGSTADIIDQALPTAVSTRYIRFYITAPTQADTPDTIDNPRARIGQIQLFPLPKTVEDPDAPSTTPAGPFSEQEDIVNARVKTSMDIDGTPLKMTTWLAPKSDVMVTSVTSDGRTPVELQSQTWSGAAGDENSAYTNTAGTSGNVMWATRSTAPGTNWVSQASLATRLLGGSDAGTHRTVGSTAETDFTLNPGQTAEIVTAVAGGGENPQNTETPAASLVSAQTPRTVAGLAAADTAWWKNYWMRSSISVPDSTLMRYYYAAQYFIGSASRPGDLAPALYGLWTTTDTPEFNGDYHQNYNAVAPFYGVYSSNRPDLALPYFGVVDSYIPQAQINAQTLLTTIEPTYLDSRFPSGGLPAGSSGVLYPVGIGPYGSTTAVTSTGEPEFWQQTVDALFNATQYSAYWDYTQNTTFLKDEAMPYLSDVADFWQYYLQKDPGTGQYDFYSGPQETTWGEDSSPDLGMLKQTLQTLQTLIAGVTALGRQADPAWVKADPTWKEILSHLPPQPTTDYNGTTVYSLVAPGTMVASASGGDGSDIHPGDNTVNLEFIAPGNQLGINSPEAEKQTAIDTLNVMNSWGQSNSFVKVFTQAAQVGYPAQQLISSLDTQIQAGTVANLNVSDGSNGLEKVGTTAAINDMLVQSSEGMIDLFPDWPPAENASFYQLLTQGGFEVSSSLSNGEVQYATVTSEAGGPLTLKDAWAGQRLSVTGARGMPVRYTVRDGAIEFSTQRGMTYQISPAGTGRG